MKISLLILGLALGSSAFAGDADKGTGTAIIDERDLEGLDTKREPQHKFEKVEEQEEREKEEAVDDPFIDNTGNSETTNRPLED